MMVVYHGVLNLEIRNDFTDIYDLRMSKEEVLKAVGSDKETLSDICSELQRAAQWIKDCKVIYTKQILAAHKEIGDIIDTEMRR